MNQKQLLGAFFVLFFLSSSYLFFVNQKGLDPTTGRGWWSVAFSEPKEQTSLIFKVLNYTENSDFTYTVHRKTELVTEGTLQIEKGSSRTIIPNTVATPDERTLIRVHHGEETQEIFR